MAHQPTTASTAATEAVTSLLTPVVNSQGLVLEDVTITPAGKRRVVRIVVDLPSGPGSLDLDAVADVARAVSEALDQAEEGSVRGPLGGAPYVLEVTSPGVERPLTLPRHWSRATDRLVRTTVSGETVTGRVVEVDDDGVRLAVDPSGGSASGAKQKEPHEERTVGWTDLGPGSVQVEFNRKDVPGDDDPDDADDDEEG